MLLDKESISYGSAFAGTTLHTAADYLTPAVNLPRVEVAEILGTKVY